MADVICGGIYESPGTANSVKTISLARFAIEEHNKEHNGLLEFVRVVNEKRQVVAGMIHYLTIEATDAGKKKLFEAKVYVGLRDDKEVSEFKEVKSTEVQEFKHVADS
ncbi:cysteine proteinase inhibitor A [Prunus yedoensis var. nudiflora]|uniref:Cysteine proteinase inhibitor n=1 Tax=Prunus yedoensis var. nudiflora TaxID=2094558 RepID=A0A314ZJB3_PRUYE|nr:cysteine proteinase inhibitor A [Prunus yedoensis var. nudiflora]